MVAGCANLLAIAVKKWGAESADARTTGKSKALTLQEIDLKSGDAAMDGASRP